MKYLLLNFFLVFYGFSGWCQSPADQQALLLKSIHHPELQNLCLHDTIYVMQHGISFPFEKLELDNNRELLFAEKSSILNSGIREFFLFREFQADNDFASIIGQYVLNFSGDVNHYVAFELKFKKEAQNWEVVTSEIKEEKQ